MQPSLHWVVFFLSSGARLAFCFHRPSPFLGKSSYLILLKNCKNDFLAEM